MHEREEPMLTDADAAARLFLHEDGFQTGLLYSEQRQAWPPAAVMPVSADAVQELSASFRI